MRRSVSGREFRPSTVSRSLLLLAPFAMNNALAANFIVTAIVDRIFADNFDGTPPMP